MFILVRDAEVGKLYVYNNLTPDSADMLQWMYDNSAKHTGFFSVYKSSEPYDPAIAHEFLETGEVSEKHLARASE